MMLLRLIRIFTQFKMFEMKISNIQKDRKCCLFGLTCKTETPVSGSLVIDGENIVGHITAGVPSPTLQLGI